MNFIQIAGRLGKDPETRFTPDGKKVISFSLATNRKKKGQEETVWYRVTVWGDQFDNLMPYIKKGSALIVVGDLEVRTYADREGKTQVSLEVTARMISFSPFGKDKDESSSSSSSSSEYSSEPMRGTAQNYVASHAGDEDIPF